MPLPDNVTVVRVRGYWLDQDGGGHQGQVVFEPARTNLTNLAMFGWVRTARVVVTPDPGDGYFFVDILATDDPDLTPFVWRVTLQGQPPMVIAVPHLSPVVDVGGGDMRRAMWLSQAAQPPTGPALGPLYYTSGQVDAAIAGATSGFATDGDLAGHAADTTGVHGIADTAQLVTTPALNSGLAGRATPGEVTAAVAAVATGVIPLAGVGDGTADDAAAINAQLAGLPARAVVRGRPGATYRVTTPIVPRSDLTLDMTGCTVALAVGSPTQMLATPGVTGGGAISNFTLIGGVWDRGSTGGVGSAQHCLIFRKVQNLIVRDVHVRSAAGKFAILLSDVTDFLIDSPYFATHSDGVHIHGGCRRGAIRNVRGTTGDDMVAITPIDWAAYTWGDESDVSDILIDGVFAEGCKHVPVKILGGLGLRCERITVRTVHGTCESHGVWIGNDLADANTASGMVDQITVEDIKIKTVTATRQPVRINAVAGGRITVRDVTWDSGSINQPAAVRVDAGTVESLVIADVHVIRGYLNTAVVLIDGTVNDLILSRVTGVLEHNMNVLRLNPGAAGATVRRALLSDIDVSWVSASGGVVAATASTHTLTRLLMSGIVARAASWIADLATPTGVMLNSAYSDASTNGFNIRATGTVVLHSAAGVDLPSAAGVVVAAGGSIACRAPGFRCNVDRLALVAGSVAYNANGALACGVGPAICNGTAWKHLYTGATYTP